MKTLVMALLSTLALTSCLIEDVRESATIQVWPVSALSGDTGTVVMLQIQRGGATAFCDGDSAASRKPAASQPEFEIMSFYFDFVFADFDSLGTGSWSEIFTHTSYDFLVNNHFADLNITSVSGSTVTGDYVLRDSEGNVTRSRQEFRARRCPDFRRPQ